MERAPSVAHREGSSILEPLNLGRLKNLMAVRHSTPLTYLHIRVFRGCQPGLKVSTLALRNLNPRLQLCHKFGRTDILSTLRSSCAVI